MKQDEIKELMEFFDKSGISKIKIKDNDFEIELEKHRKAQKEDEKVRASAQTQVQPINVVVNNEQPNLKDTINSPMVGTFYQASNPGAAPFVKPGQNVTKGTTIAIIEAMKIMNEIEAEFDCRILKNLVSDGSPVEFGMPLFEVEKL